MALDWLMLEKFPEPDAIRLRCYGWSHPAWTFGYGQKWIEAHAASNHAAELIRRPTGGGLVDHRHDWTYALVIPATHPLAQARACDSYRTVHEALSAALMDAGVDNRLYGDCPPIIDKFSMLGGLSNEGRSKPAPLQKPEAAQCRGADLLRPLSLPSAVKSKFSICFHQPERFDLVRTEDGRKIAGAAQKRTRQGMLLQGTVDKCIAAEVLDWGKFGDQFSQHLALKLDLATTLSHSPPWADLLLKNTIARFASGEWNQRR